MAYRPNPDDQRLKVEFYTKDKRGRQVEMVKVSDTTNPLLVQHFRALDVSHRDPVTDEEVTYAERFAPQYAAFKRGDTKTSTDKIEKLQNQITEEEAKMAGAEVDPKAAEAAAEKAAGERQKELDADREAAEAGNLAEVGKAAAEAAVAATKRASKK